MLYVYVCYSTTLPGREKGGSFRKTAGRFSTYRQLFIRGDIKNDNFTYNIPPDRNPRFVFAHASEEKDVFLSFRECDLHCSRNR